MNETLTLPLDEVKRKWIEDAAPMVLRIMSGAGDFTTDDLHSVLPTPGNVNWFGVLMAQLRNTGKIQPWGFMRSKRKQANGRLIQVWRVKE